MNKAKMTFRFDQPHRRDTGLVRKPMEPQVIPLHQDEYKVSLIDAQTLNPYTNDFGGWQSSFDTETLRVEKLIRESGNPTAPPAPPFSSHEELLMPGEGIRRGPAEPIRDHYGYVPEERSYVRHRIGTSWLKVAAAVAGAVATGAAFGFLVLSMFSDESQANQELVKGQAPASLAAQVQVNTSKAGAAGAGAAATEPAAPAGGAPIAKAGAAGSDKPLAVDAPSMPASAMVSAPVSTTATASTLEPTAASTEAAVSVSIPAKTLILLQSGVFSTSQGAEVALGDLKKQGLAAVSDSGDKYPVYVALASNREEAVGLAQSFQQKKIEVIVKNVELPALTKIKWSGKQIDAIPAFIAQSDKLVQLIAPLTSKQLSESMLAALDASTLQSVKAAHQAWSGTIAGVNEGLNDEGRLAVQKINSAMNAAIASLDEYKKSPAATHLWQTQNALMQATLAQKELRKMIAAP
ncbi:SPOR domain-containing protein [Paenibacillus agricola]|uniref:SPOR domain-containing protein n=1 Tax=Paenibacillus agricola TaxID=2716264 RepID=A0ABX0J7V1_9BACL|nr:hypothetical protein [Paenibacillus agricola]NHN30101.1 hypothetical protein [Paenibacillus agricola]